MNVETKAVLAITINKLTRHHILEEKHVTSEPGVCGTGAPQSDVQQLPAAQTAAFPESPVCPSSKGKRVCGF